MPGSRPRMLLLETAGLVSKGRVRRSVGSGSGISPWPEVVRRWPPAARRASARDAGYCHTAVWRLFTHNGFVAKGVRTQRSDLGDVWGVAGEGPAFGVRAAVATGVHPRDVAVAGFEKVLEAWEQPAHGGRRLLDDGHTSSAGHGLEEGPGALMDEKTLIDLGLLRWGEAGDPVEVFGSPQGFGAAGSQVELSSTS